MKNLIQNLKENDQDFEFYPTTNQIILQVYYQINSGRKDRYYDESFSLLEIGCGNGKVFKKLEEFAATEKAEQEKTKEKSNCVYLKEKFAIEKSQILINQLPEDVVILGTDFHEQTLIDKQVDYIFCNPPYSEFEQWSAKIIREGFAKAIFLVIPQRWENSHEIKDALKSRNFEATILGDFDFLEADRQARAKVHLLKIAPKKKQINDRYYEEKVSDPFDTWFESEFKINCEKTKDFSESAAEREARNEKRKAEIENEIVAGRDLVQVLVALYQRDLQNLIKTYQKLGEIDAELLKELNVNLDGVKEALKSKINGLKVLYWREIFNRLDKIRERLCSSQRSELFRKLAQQTSIDFTESNVYAVAIWIVKNSNKYFDAQIVDIYKQLSAKENIKNYKSNKKTWEEDRWRYNREEKTHYCLDYRLIYSGNWNHSYSRGSELSQNSIDLVNDLLTIAENLGFDGQSEKAFNWSKSPEFGKKVEFWMRPNWRNDNTTKSEIFMEARFYKNGNFHFKLNQQFIKALNIEAARILKWINSPKEAVEEFPEDCKVSEMEAQKYFKNNFTMLNSNLSQLLLN